MQQDEAFDIEEKKWSRPPTWQIRGVDRDTRTLVEDYRERHQLKSVAVALGRLVRKATADEKI
jgi:hypothetical protein